MESWFKPLELAEHATQRHASTTFGLNFFFCTKIKIPLVLNNNNKKNYYKITIKSLKPRLTVLNGKGNKVITLFINL